MHNRESRYTRYVLHERIPMQKWSFQKFIAILSWLTMQHKKYRERAKTIKSKLHKLFWNFYYATMERNIENYGQDNNSYNKRNLHSNEIK